MSLNCSKCDVICSKGLKKGQCNRCYERNRRALKLLITLVCNHCGPVTAKKLTSGLCIKCYSSKRNNKIKSECIKCENVKNNIFVKGLCQACYSDSHRENNPEKYLSSRIKNRENRNKSTAKWAKENPGLKAAKEAKRRAQKIQAMPKWVDLAAIKDFYSKCPPGYHVDHIIPLQNDNICGLHILNNLQYLKSEDNCIKSNKFDGTPNNDSWRKVK